jgi:cob(I)alamin adenosyltransferase
MKTYTRRGDSGQTSIWGGRRLSKDHVRIEAIGAVDDCNAAVGTAIALGLPDPLITILHAVQNRLFIVGSELMAPDRSGSGSHLPRLTEQDVQEVEDAIDRLEQALPELRNFILPGGSAAGAALHVARGACRHSERRVATSAKPKARFPPYLFTSIGLLICCS